MNNTENIFKQNFENMKIFIDNLNENKNVNYKKKKIA